MSYRVAASGQYSCSRCLRPLTTYRAGAFDIDACTACGGLFIDNAASQELVRAFDRDLVNVATWLGIGKGESIGPGVKRSDLNCPRCGGPLTAVNLPAAATEIDICAEHGTWFDANELPKVARAYRRSREGTPVDMAAEEVARVLEHRWR